MGKINSNYLINKLEEGKKLNITLFSHNVYWYEIQKLSRYFENCNVQVFGDGTSYIKIADMERLLQVEASDLIIWYSSRPYNEIELNELKKLAIRIANNKNKRVGIGYLYSVPLEHRTSKNMCEEIKIISYYNVEQYEKLKCPTTAVSVFDLTNMTLEILENEIDLYREQDEVDTLNRTDNEPVLIKK